MKSKKLTEVQKLRRDRLCPKGAPKYARCYDNGGVGAENGSGDRYTVVLSGRAATMTSPGCANEYPYLAMNGSPFHPQGIGMHGCSKNHPCDAPPGKWPPAIGRKCHLGRRISFTELPDDCRRCALQDYAEIWKIDLKWLLSRYRVISIK